MTSVKEVIADSHIESNKTRNRRNWLNYDLKEAYRSYMIGRIVVSMMLALYYHTPPMHEWFTNIAFDCFSICLQLKWITWHVARCWYWTKQVMVITKDLLNTKLPGWSPKGYCVCVRWQLRFVAQAVGDVIDSILPDVHNETHSRITWALLLRVREKACWSNKRWFVQHIQLRSWSLHTRSTTISHIADDASFLLNMHKR